MRPELKEKVEYSIALLRKGEKLALKMQPEMGYLLAFSGGKDSQCLLHLAKQAGVKFRAEYHVTTNDAAENVRFIRENYPEVVFDVPEKSYFRMIEKHGLPQVMRRWCCREFKENKGKNCVVISGVRAAESSKRAKYTEFERHAKRKETRGPRNLDKMEENQFQCLNGHDKFMLYPILHWLEEDVWEYIAEMGIPRNPCYDQGSRVGCIYCPFTRPEKLRKHIETHPKQYGALLHSVQRYIDRSGGETEFKDAEDMVQWWMSKLSVKKYREKQQQLSIMLKEQIP